MIIYLFFFSLLFFPAFVLARSRLAAWYMGGVIFLISALRYNVGFDYETYFLWASSGIDYYQASTMEPLSRMILEFALNSREPQLFFVLSSLIVVGLFSYSYIRCSQFPALSLLFFFSMPLLFLTSLGIIRQYMAVAVVFFALTVLRNRPKSVVAMFFLAGLLHYSAWIMILMWPFLRWFDRPIAIGWTLAALLSAPVLSFALTGILSQYLPLYNYYIQNDMDSGLKMIFFYYLLAVGILWMSYRGVDMPRRYLNLFMFGVVLFGLLGSVNQVVGRLAYFFLPFIAILLPNCIALIKPALVVRFIAAFLMVGILILQLHIASTNPEKDPYQPYLIFQGVGEIY
jgi:EpsG family